MAEKQTAPALPASEPFPGSRTPGWNDPPTVQFNPPAAGSNTNRTRLNLNKRVAFPLQGTIGAAGADSQASKPTAIVPPNLQTPPISTNATQPIAVVHPMMPTVHTNTHPPVPAFTPVMTPQQATNNETTSVADTTNQNTGTSCSSVQHI